MNRSIQEWLDDDRRPAHLYQLLGRPTFDPDQSGLMAAIRTAYAQLLPYENHKDHRVSERATELLRELGRAEHLLLDSAKLKAHHESIFAQLRSDYASARSQSRQPWTPERIRTWLAEQGIHRQRIDAAARLLAAEDETADFRGGDTCSPPPSSPLAPDAFVLEEHQPPDQSTAPRAPDGTLGPASQPVLAEVVGEPQRSKPDGPKRPEVNRSPGTPATARQTKTAVGRPAKAADKRIDRRAGGTTGQQRSRQLFWILGAAAGIWIILVAVLWLVYGNTETWRGRLVQLRGHGGEIHLLVRLDGAGGSAGRARYAEAVVPDYRFDREIADYVADDEARAGGDRVVLEGTRRDPDRVQFRLGDPAETVLVELRAVQIEGEPPSRAEVGRRRSAFRSKRIRSTLAGMIRIHPEPGESTGFHARFHTATAAGVEVFPSLTDERRVMVEFPSASPGDFALYQPEDEVYVVATLSPNATAERLVLRGVEIRRLKEPNAPVSAAGGVATMSP